jgi:hypothetical protein
MGKGVLMIHKTLTSPYFIILGALALALLLIFSQASHYVIFTDWS